MQDVSVQGVASSSVGVVIGSGAPDTPSCARSTVWMAVTCARRWQGTNGGWLSICMPPRERAVNAWLCVTTETGEVTLQQTDAKLCERRSELWTLSLRARMVLQVEACKNHITAHPRPLDITFRPAQSTCPAASLRISSVITPASSRGSTRSRASPAAPAAGPSIDSLAPSKVAAATDSPSAKGSS